MALKCDPEDLLPHGLLCSLQLLFCEFRPNILADEKLSESFSVVSQNQ